jgi:hypothetical protein
MRRFLRPLTAALALGLALSLTGASQAIAQGVQPLPSPYLCALGAAPLAALSDDTTVSPLLGNLGDHSMPITTRSALAQKYFDEGLILSYGFNHAEAIRSFADAARLDPSCAMCQWGIAYALGPNINLPMDPAAAAPAVAAIQKAQALAKNASPREQAYIAAMAQRYSADPAADRVALDKAYAHHMRLLMQAYPDDLDAATLFAEALMDLAPWNYWTPEGQMTPYTYEILLTLESVMARNPNHPGANHFYIHATEASKTPERAIPSAERLETLVPGAGHLRHMPAHTYWRVGRYADAYRVNEVAASVDERTVGGTPDDPTHGFYALAYYPHNLHFLFAAAQMEGRSAEALASARKTSTAIPEAVYAEIPPLEDWKPLPLFAMVRFGQWDAILAEPAPAPELRYSSGMWHWARGMALANSGQLEAAQAEYEQLTAIAADESLAGLFFGSFASAGQMLGMAAQLLASELAGAQGDSAAQVAALEAAVATQDGLAYIEPPAWHFPLRQYLGAALLEAGRASEAEAVYRADLEQYPQNGWSLFGLAQSLRAQGRDAEADEAQAAFEQAWQRADVTLTRSRL